MKAQFILSSILALTAVGCTKIKSMTTTTHKVTFDVDLVSTDGKNSFQMDCFDAGELKAYLEEQGAAFMTGKKPKLEQPKAITYKSEGKPPVDESNNFKFTLDLPSRNNVCGVGMKTVTVRVGEKASDVFKPLADTTIKVKYNMYTKTMYKASSDGAQVEIIEVK